MENCERRAIPSEQIETRYRQPGAALPSSTLTNPAPATAAAVPISKPGRR